MQKRPLARRYINDRRSNDNEASLPEANRRSQMSRRQHAVESSLEIQKLSQEGKGGMAAVVQVGNMPNTTKNSQGRNMYLTKSTNAAVTDLQGQRQSFQLKLPPGVQRSDSKSGFFTNTVQSAVANQQRKNQAASKIQVSSALNAQPNDDNPNIALMQLLSSQNMPKNTSRAINTASNDSRKVYLNHDGSVVGNSAKPSSSLNIRTSHLLRETNSSQEHQNQPHANTNAFGSRKYSYQRRPSNTSTNLQKAASSSRKHPADTQQSARQMQFAQQILALQTSTSTGQAPSSSRQGQQPQPINRRDQKVKPTDDHLQSTSRLQEAIVRSTAASGTRKADSQNQPAKCKFIDVDRSTSQKHKRLGQINQNQLGSDQVAEEGPVTTTDHETWNKQAKVQSTPYQDQYSSQADGRVSDRRPAKVQGWFSQDQTPKVQLSTDGGNLTAISQRQIIKLRGNNHNLTRNNVHRGQGSNIFDVQRSTDVHSSIEREMTSNSMMMRPKQKGNQLMDSQDHNLNRVVDDRHLFSSQVTAGSGVGTNNVSVSSTSRSRLFRSTNYGTQQRVDPGKKDARTLSSQELGPCEETPLRKMSTHDQDDHNSVSSMNNISRPVLNSQHSFNKDGVLTPKEISQPASVMAYGTQSPNMLIQNGVSPLLVQSSNSGGKGDKESLPFSGRNNRGQHQPLTVGNNQVNQSQVVKATGANSKKIPPSGLMIAHSIQNCQIQGRKMAIEDQSALASSRKDLSSIDIIGPQTTLIETSRKQLSSRHILGNSKDPDTKTTDKKPSNKQFVAIRIINENKEVVKTYISEKSVIVSTMKYFSKHLGSIKDTEDDDNDMIDIQVCCDATIFKFLLDYCTELHENGVVKFAKLKQLETRLLFPVLISSVFLQIDPLIDECITFWQSNFEQIMVQEKIPQSQLDTGTFTKLCDVIKVDRILQFERKYSLIDAQVGNEKGEKSMINHKIISKMYMHLAMRLLDDESFTTCQFCSEIYPSAHVDKLKCQATRDFFVDDSERQIQMHIADRQLDLKRMFEYLNEEKKVPWRTLYARIMARVVLLPRCSVCLDRPSAAFLNSCNSHVLTPSFNSGAHIGVYPCCGQHVLRAAYEQHQEEVQRLAQQVGRQSSQGTKMALPVEAKQCNQPLGCRVQDHSYDSDMLNKSEQEMLEFLQQPEIAKVVFETRVSKQTEAILQSGEPGLAQVVQNYRSEIKGMLDQFRKDQDSLQNEIPPEINQSLGDNTSPAAANNASRYNNLINYAFGDIIEQYEDDYESDDSEFLEHMRQKMGVPPGGSLSNTNTNEDSSRYGQSTMPTSLAGSRSNAAQVNPLHGHESVEQALLAQWKVKSLTRKKVRLHGKEVHYTFKFNLASKMNEAARKFTKQRDERLRNLDEEGDKKISNEHQLAIPSSKELFVKRGNFNDFSQAQVRVEMRQMQREFDEKRMQRLTDQMLRLRAREDSKDAEAQSTAVKIQKKTEKEQKVLQQKMTVNRLAANKESLQRQQQKVEDKSNQVMQTTEISQITNNVPSQSQASSVPTSATKIKESNQPQKKVAIVPIAVQSYSYMSPKANTSGMQTHKVQIPSTLQQKITMVQHQSSAAIGQSLQQASQRAANSVRQNNQHQMRLQITSAGSQGQSLIQNSQSTSNQNQARQAALTIVQSQSSSTKNSNQVQTINGRNMMTQNINSSKMPVSLVVSSSAARAAAASNSGRQTTESVSRDGTSPQIERRKIMSDGSGIREFGSLIQSKDLGNGVRIPANFIQSIQSAYVQTPERKQLNNVGSGLVQTASSFVASKNNTALSNNSLERPSVTEQTMNRATESSMFRRNPVNTGSKVVQLVKSRRPPESKLSGSKLVTLTKPPLPQGQVIGTSSITPSAKPESTDPQISNNTRPNKGPVVQVKSYRKPQ